MSASDLYVRVHVDDGYALVSTIDTARLVVHLLDARPWWFRLLFGRELRRAVDRLRDKVQALEGMTI